MRMTRNTTTMDRNHPSVGRIASIQNKLNNLNRNTNIPTVGIEYHCSLFFCELISFLLLCSLFQLSAHPDDPTRQELADKIGLEARQVKFWFQNQRTKTKV